MSLINEALKKAQRQRHDEQTELGAPMPGGGSRISRRTSAPSTQSMVLLATVGIALFVVCVVVAVSWINRPTPVKPVSVKPVVAAASVETAAPVSIVVPLIGSAKAVESPNSGPKDPARATEITITSAPFSPAPTTATSTLSSARSAPISDSATSTRTAPPVIAPPDFAANIGRSGNSVAATPAPPAGKFDERIQNLVDAFRVAGIRASGTGSRVLLNEKVFKIDDVVDRTHGLRLTQVTNDRLTFTTPDGITYVKNF